MYICAVFQLLATQLPRFFSVRLHSLLRLGVCNIERKRNELCTRARKIFSKNSQNEPRHLESSFQRLWQPALQAESIEQQARGVFSTGGAFPTSFSRNFFLLQTNSHRDQPQTLVFSCSCYSSSWLLLLLLRKYIKLAVFVSSLNPGFYAMGINTEF